MLTFFRHLSGNTYRVDTWIEKPPESVLSLPEGATVIGTPVPSKSQLEQALDGKTVAKWRSCGGKRVPWEVWARRSNHCAVCFDKKCAVCWRTKASLWVPVCACPLLFWGVDMDASGV